MTRSFSQKQRDLRASSKEVRKAELNAMSETYPFLATAVRTFEEYKLTSDDVTAIIKGQEPENFTNIKDEVDREVVRDLAMELYEGYKPYIRRHEPGRDSLKTLSHDMDVLFSFSGDMKYYGVKQSVENRLQAHAIEVSAQLEAQFNDLPEAVRNDAKPALPKGKTAAVRFSEPSSDQVSIPAKPVESITSEKVDRSGMAPGYKALAAGSAAVSIAAGAKTRQNWKDRFKNPESRGKTIAFAAVTVVAAVALTAAVAMGIKSSPSGRGA